MMKALILFGMLGACTQSGNQYLDDDLWDSDIVPASDGIYVSLPHAESLVRVKDDASWGEVDLDGANPNRIIPSPDGSSILVFADWEECSDDDAELVYKSDCPEALVKHSELAIIEDGVRTQVLSIPSHLNTVEFSSDGSIAVAYLDYSMGGEISVDGVADLGEVAFIRLADGVKSSVSVGFSPSRVLFGPNNTAVVMSRSQVVAVDLSTFEKVLEAPLSLDADQQIDPSGAELAYDAESGNTTLLLTVNDSTDLYMLDLANEFWNIGDLGAVPSAIGVDNSSSKSVFVFGSSSKAVILDHGSLSTLNSSSLDTISLEEPSNSTLLGEGFALLYHSSNDYVHDVYRLDLNTQELTEYVVANPLSSLSLTPSGAHAVGIMRPEYAYSSGVDAYQDSRWGIAILDTTTNDAVSLVAESQPIALQMIENDSGSFALILMEGLDYLLQVDLNAPSSSNKVELPAAPLDLDTMPDGRFVISHDVDTGMISFLEPATLELNTIDGFALEGILRDPILSRRTEEE
jgi:hypothetical protein